MRTTLALDSELVAKAQAFTGVKEMSALIREALKALIERESAHRLAASVEASRTSKSCRAGEAHALLSQDR